MKKTKRMTNLEQREAKIAKTKEVISSLRKLLPLTISFKALAAIPILIWLGTVGGWWAAVGGCFIICSAYEYMVSLMGIYQAYQQLDAIEYLKTHTPKDGE